MGATDMDGKPRPEGGHLRAGGHRLVCRHIYMERKPREEGVMCAAGEQGAREGADFGGAPERIAYVSLAGR